MKQTKGWFKESLRHSNAKRFGNANKIDLKRYAGTWKQTKVTNQPSFQRGCEEVTATYTPMKDGRIKVTNKCYKKGKLNNQISGTARSVSDNNKKLKVSFFPFVEGDYNIKKINKDYTRATVQSGKTKWELKKIQ